MRVCVHKIFRPCASATRCFLLNKAPNAAACTRNACGCAVPLGWQRISDFVAGYRHFPTPASDRACMPLCRMPMHVACHSARSQSQCCCMYGRVAWGCCMDSCFRCCTHAPFRASSKRSRGPCCAVAPWHATGGKRRGSNKVLTMMPMCGLSVRDSTVCARKSAGPELLTCAS